MSSYEFDLPDDRDADARFERDMRAEDEEAREDRLLEEFRHRTDWKPAKRMLRTDAPRPDERWREQILARDGGCILHRTEDCPEPRLEFHHVLPQAFMRRNGLGALLWNPSVGVTLCCGSHRQHHNRKRPIRLEELPAVVRDFIEGLDFGFYLQRHYPSSRRETEAA